MSATNRGAKRDPKDRYNTPEYAVKLICGEIDWSNVMTFYEPCRGKDHIWNVVKIRRGYSLKMFWSEIDRGRDYLKGKKWQVDLTLTNPPFSLAREFIDQARSHSSVTVMLLRLNYLGSQKRREWWQNQEPDYIFALSERPCFEKKKSKRTGKLLISTDATEYGWFVWVNYVGVKKIIKRKPGIYIL